jgi:PEP-CTERM motif-containing protein
MRSRAFRPIAAILSVLLLAGSPVHAGPVAISEVIQVIASYQNPPDLRLRNVSQSGNTAMAGASGSTRATSAVKQSAVNGSLDIIDTSAASPNSSDSLLAGVATDSNDSQGTVDIIDQGDVEGTVCDCGEITVAGGFPKWPLLFLAAIPFFFIHDCDDCETPSPTPTPTPTPPEKPIPEPASLLLFGSGLAALGAGFRRRYAKAKLAAQVQTTEEG